MNDQGASGLEHLWRLSAKEAEALTESYWEQKNRFLGAFHRLSAEVGHSVPDPVSGFDRDALNRMGPAIEALLARRGLSVPDLSNSILEILDPIDHGQGFSKVDAFLALCVSYAVADALLHTVEGTKMAPGRSKVARYINQNQPVVVGKWGETGALRDLPTLTIGRMTIRDFKEGRDKKIDLVDTYDRYTSFPRSQGLVHQRHRDKPHSDAL